MKRIIIGQTPVEETPSTNLLQQLNNTRRLRLLVGTVIGEPDLTCRGRLGTFHLPGQGYVLAYTWDPDCERAQEFAENLAWELPLTWDGSHSRPIPPPPAARQLQTVELGRYAA